MDRIIIVGGDVLYLWHSDAQLEANVNAIRALANVTGVKVENGQQITAASYANSTFAAVVVAANVEHLGDDLVAMALSKLKPKGRLVLLDSAAVLDELKGRLVLGGFVNVHVANGSVLGDKPNYETGSAATLSLGSLKLATDQAKAKVAAVWTIDNDDDEIIDADELLDEEDLVAPDPSLNRVCGTTGKKKACRDCSCGLAEELAGAAKPKADPNQKSSCGSCYLGDAFRCASCPYIGMPAFKPGEKIQLNENFLESA